MTNMVKPTKTPSKAEARKTFKIKATNIVYIILMNVNEDTFQHTQVETYKFDQNFILDFTCI